MDTLDIPATLTAFGAMPAPAVATVLHQTAGQRLARTAGGLGLFWGLALAGLFIPVAHFILVPTFLGAGVVAAIIRAREDRRLLKLRGACPRCGAAQEFEVGGRFASGRTFDCVQCHGNVTLVVDGEAPAPP